VMKRHASPESSFKNLQVQRRNSYITFNRL
jgi:hypothetical protein